MKRIVMHWTAGTRKVSPIDKEHYHFIVDGDGEVFSGTRNPEANLDTRDGDYTAHTRGFNTGSIGVAMAGMYGAKERPFEAGGYSLTTAQLRAFSKLVADLCMTYGIPVTRRTVLTHAEVEPTWGVKQRGKWDIVWLPGWTTTRDPILAGDALRAMIQSDMREEAIPVVTPRRKPVWPSWVSWPFSRGGQR